MNILAIGIHPDDIELGCGGTVALAARAGHRVVLADLSDGASSSNGTPAERAREAKDAAGILGASERINLGLPDTGIRSEDAEQVKSVVACIRDVRPDLVLVPSSDDPHPDHMSGGALVERALYLSGIHGYEKKHTVWKVRDALVYPGRNEIEPHLVVDISATFPTRMEAIEAHRSQFLAEGDRKPTALNSPDFLPFIEARCRLYGGKIGVRYGEPFRSLRPLAVTNFDIFTAADSAAPLETDETS